MKLQLLGITSLLYFALCPGLHAQHSIFLTEGKIEFEKRVNAYANLEEGDEWDDLMKKTMAKYKTYYFDLYFSNNKTLYQPGKENPDNNKQIWEGNGLASENVIYSLLDSCKSISQKKVFETMFLIKDSTRKINWKITNETRTIAGFQCRRANAIIMDTIYVVAFYTDEIIPSGGPESFTGLPGMILGVSLPHKHVTWFATKVSAEPPGNQIKIPTKGKPVTTASLKVSLKDIMKDWDVKYRQRNLEAVVL